MSHFRRHFIAPTALQLVLSVIVIEVSSGSQLEANNVTCVWVPTDISVASTTTGSPGLITTSTAADDTNDTIANETIASNAFTTSTATTTGTVLSTTTGSPPSAATTAAAGMVSTNDTDDNSTDAGTSNATASRRLEESMPARRYPLLARKLQASGYWNCTAVDDVVEETTTPIPVTTTAVPQVSNSTTQLQNITSASNTTLKANSSSNGTSTNKSGPAAISVSPNSNPGADNEGSSDSSESSDTGGCSDAIFCSGHGSAAGSSSSQCSCDCDEKWSGERCSIFIDDAPSTASQEAYEGGFKTTTVLICGGGAIALIVALGVVWARLGKKEKMTVMPENGEAAEKNSKCSCLKKGKGKIAERLAKKKELAEKAKSYQVQDQGPEGTKSEGADDKSSKPDGDPPKASEAEADTAGEKGDKSDPKEEDTSKAADAPKEDAPKADAGEETAKDLN
eukprot:gnl/MRDRNA2_/MRDRNA2_96666_c0_seq1.p1 gnl/MRDRNA2_/MRDRNA2_96666_c0~~gnl/MRDRNA2_/MRDRNA2_96666_c0_seq1.p1  ORF type:complete len:479 (+),score=107.19 gnl/MRDRNA2_/MRDRNA2_96666_c0_seq1:82-1437(+)